MPSQPQAGARERLRELIARVIGWFARRIPLRLAVILQEQLRVIERLDYEKSPIFLRIHSRLEHAYRIHSCKREPETVVWIEGQLRDGDIMFDVGANVGAYSLIAAKHSRGTARVYAFEPAFANFAALCENIALNRCADSIVPLNIALSDQTTLGTFNYSELSAGSSLHAFGTNRSCKGQFTPLLQQLVLSYRVDDLLRTLPIPVPNLIKIDVDGIELEILRGASNTLNDRQLRSLLVEIEPESEHRSAICDLMDRHGFRLLPPWRQGSPNSIFVR